MEEENQEEPPNPRSLITISST